MKAVIIAGGLGTRLRPLTYNTPKPIVPVANYPFLVRQIDLLVKHGIKEVIINLHYLSDEIKRILGDGKRWGIKIYYSLEREPLGTAGAVKNAEQFFDDEPMIVFNGDILTDINLTELVKFHRQREAEVTLTLIEVEDPTSFGLVLTEKDGRVKKFIEKPSWDMVTAKTVNAGIYVLDPKIFKDVPRDRQYSFERQLYPDLLASGGAIYGWLAEGYWLDIGNPDKYKEAHQAILREDIIVNLNASRIEKKVWLGKESKVDPAARLIGPCLIGAKSKIAAETEIRDYVVLGDNVTIDQACVLDRTIVWQDTKIGKGVVLSDCIVGRNCTIEDHVHVEHGLVLADNSVLKKGTKIF